MTSIPPHVDTDRIRVAVSDGDLLPNFIGLEVKIIVGVDPSFRSESQVSAVDGEMFHPTMAIVGTLEGGGLNEDGDPDMYRVVVDDQTYAYFEPKDIQEVLYGVKPVDPQDYPDGPPERSHGVIDEGGEITHWQIADAISERLQVSAVVGLRWGRGANDVDKGDNKGDNPDQNPSASEAS